MLGILSRAFIPLLSPYYAWIVPLAFGGSFIAPRSVSLEIAIWAVFLCAACLELRRARGESKGRSFFERSLHALTSNRIATTLGECSYSTYLIHIPLFSLFGWAIAQATGEWNQRLCGISTTIAVIALVPVSLLLYRLIELRFVRLGSEIARARPTSRFKAG